MTVPTLKIGSKAPSFNLPGVDGKNHSLEDYHGMKALVVIFSCNHCPYVVAYEDRMVELQRDYGPKRVQLIAINSNETKNFPEDDFPNMVKRAKDKGFNFPYLRDENQSIAGAYRPTKTPEVFLFNQNLVLMYHGAIDDNYEDPKKVKKKYLRDALDNVLAGQLIKTANTTPVGCSVKWL